MELLEHMRRITLCLREAFPHAEVAECEENVASMSLADRAKVSKFMGSGPWCFDSADLRCQRRKRFFWCTWGVAPRPGVRLAGGAGYTRVHLEPTRKPVARDLLAPGWGPHASFDGRYPTLTRPCAVSTPRFHTPGDNIACAATLAAWKADQHRRPPIHYEDRFQIVKDRDGAGRARTTE